MGKRATGRKLAMQLLYQMDIRGESDQKDVNDFFDKDAYDEATIEWASSLANEAWTFVEESDKLISSYSIDWELNRITSVDKSILRVAFYELIHTDTPHHVVLNEAIELSKTYSTEDSPKFINGILGNYVKEKCLPE